MPSHFKFFCQGRTMVKQILIVVALGVQAIGAAVNAVETAGVPALHNLAEKETKTYEGKVVSTGRKAGHRR